MTTPTLDRETILQTIRAWPRDEQVALVQDILQALGEAFVEEPLAPPDSRGLAGLIANDRPPPTDEEVARWLDERRMNKYGSQ